MEVTLEKIEILEETWREIALWRKDIAHWREKERQQAERDTDIQKAQRRMIEDFCELLRNLRDELRIAGSGNEEIGTEPVELENKSSKHNEEMGLHGDFGDSASVETPD